MKERILAFRQVLTVLALALICTVVPSLKVKAEDYGVWINGYAFTEVEQEITCGEGKATYDPKTHTLTLDNATITE
ncbi:MAG: hypothetical protein K5739_09265, partial [Lachnospiraceae bacterium]|nr:hypothetical protein [Lachnospiraceae bacterium]